MMIDGHVLRPIVEESIVHPHNTFFSRDVEVGKQAHVLFRWEEKLREKYTMHHCSVVPDACMCWVPILMCQSVLLRSMRSILVWWHTDSNQLTLCELMLKLVCSLVTFNFSAIPLAILSLATPAVLSLLKNNNKVPFGIVFWTVFLDSFMSSFT